MMYRALQRLGRQPVTVAFSGSDPIAHVISLNLKRRHLDATQRAVAAQKALGIYETEAKKRQLTTLKKGLAPVSANLREQEKGKAVEKAAADFNVSPRQIEKVKATLKTAVPEVVRDMERGNLSLNTAAQLAKETPEVRW